MWYNIGRGWKSKLNKHKSITIIFLQLEFGNPNATKGTPRTKERQNKMKKAKFEIWMNGHYIESFRTLEQAEARVRTYERLDRYEIEVEGYTNALPTYEIKVA